MCLASVSPSVRWRSQASKLLSWVARTERHHVGMVNVPSLLFFKQTLKGLSCLWFSKKDQIAYILQPELQHREAVLPSGGCSFFHFTFSISQLSFSLELCVHCCTPKACSNIWAQGSKVCWVHRLILWSTWFIWKGLLWSSKPLLHFRGRMSPPSRNVALKPHSLLRTADQC